MLEIFNFLNVNTGMFTGCTSFELDLFSGNKQQVRIQVLRNGSELRLQDIHFNDLTPIYVVDPDIPPLSKAHWKTFVTTNALLLKDSLFISDVQFDELIKFCKRVLQQQGITPNRYLCWLPPLNGVLNMRKNLNKDAPTKLGLKIVMGGPTAGSAYSRSDSILGAEFDARKIIWDVISEHWDALKHRVEAGKPIFLRSTIDGAKLDEANQYLTASILLPLDGLESGPELLLKMIKCKETKENVDDHFAPLFKELESMNDEIDFSFLAPGAEKAVNLKLKIIFGPDAKMLNTLCGGKSHMSNCFCVQCKATAEEVKDDPYKFWPKGDPQVPSHTPVVTQIGNVVNCTLHFLLRTCECIFGATLRLCNDGAGGFSRDEHEKYIVQVCGISGFRLLGDISTIGEDKKPSLPWTSLSGSQWKKLIFKFDLSRVYSGERLKLAKILITLLSLISFGIERKAGAIGDLTGKQIRILALVMIRTFKSLYGKYPGARYLHYLTNHMGQTKDELALQGLSLGEISTASSELLQKGAKMQFRRATNHRNDSIPQVFSRASRMRAATAAIKKVVNGAEPNFLRNKQDISRKREKEIRRHTALIVQHQCTRNNINKEWFEKTLNSMEKKGNLTAEDLVGINNDDLLFCPFCHILGEETSSKPPTRTTYQVVIPVEEIAWCDSETTESYEPSEEELRELQESDDYKTDSEDSCSEDEDENAEDDM